MCESWEHTWNSSNNEEFIGDSINYSTTLSHQHPAINLPRWAAKQTEIKRQRAKAVVNRQFSVISAESNQ
jgi:hypothetical protein